MGDVSTWAPVAANNNQRPPNGWPELVPDGGMSRGSVNDTFQETHAAIRRLAQDQSWFDWGHAATYQSGTVFQVPGDQTAVYQTNRRVRAMQPSQTIFGRITGAVFTAATDVTVEWDASGALASEALAISVGTHVEIANVDNLGSAAFVEAGNAIGQIPVLEDVNSAAGLAAINGSQLTGVSDWRLLDTRTISNDVDQQFLDADLFNGTYSEVKYVCRDILPVSSGVNLWCQVSTNGGTSWLAGTAYLVMDHGIFYNQTLPDHEEFRNMEQWNRWGVAGDISIGGNIGVHGEVAYSGLGARPHIRAKMFWDRAAFGISGNNVWGYLEPNVTPDVNGFRFVASSGNLSSGQIRVYGVP